MPYILIDCCMHGLSYGRLSSCFANCQFANVTARFMVSFRVSFKGRIDVGLDLVANQPVILLN